RRFVLSPAFKSNYALDDETYDKIANSDIDCMYFGFRLLRQVLFNEKTIPEVDGALDKRVEERAEVIEMRRKIEAEQIKARDPYLAYKQEVDEEKLKKEDE
ncbi:MAG: YkgJ family cysteine cluster protein, partial [Gammaproteobacteria bacterium]|nr:YkgJ family cysteine cluster protein [Gammaproteobacteria bacterium]